MKVFPRTFFLTLGLAAIASIAQAVPITWTFTGVTFDDGGTASGTFVYDPALGKVLSAVTATNITTTAGTTLSGYTYSQAKLNSFNLGAPSSGGQICWSNSSPGGLCLTFGAFPLNGGTVSIALSSFENGPARLVTAGTVVGAAPPSSVSSTPALSTWGLGLLTCAMGFAGIRLLRRTA